MLGKQTLWLLLWSVGVFREMGGMKRERVEGTGEG